MLRKLPNRLYVEDVLPSSDPVSKNNFDGEEYILYNDTDVIAENADSDELEGDGVLVGVYKLVKMVRVRRTYKTIVQDV